MVQSGSAGGRPTSGSISPVSAFRNSTTLSDVTQSRRLERALVGLVLRHDKAAKDARTVVGGAFDVDARGGAWVSIEPPTNLDNVRAVTVTDEPVPGGTAPTSATLLDGRL